MIDNQYVIARAAHRPVFNRQLFEVIAGGALRAVDAGRGIKGDVRAQMAERILQAEWFKNGIAGMELAAAENGPTLGFFLQRQKGVQRIADAGKGQGVIDRVNDPGVVVPQSKKAI